MMIIILNTIQSLNQHLLFQGSRISFEWWIRMVKKMKMVKKREKMRNKKSEAIYYHNYRFRWLETIFSENFPALYKRWFILLLLTPLPISFRLIWVPVKARAVQSFLLPPVILPTLSPPMRRDVDPKCPVPYTFPRSSPRHCQDLFIQRPPMECPTLKSPPPHCPPHSVHPAVPTATAPASGKAPLSA